MRLFSNQTVFLEYLCGLLHRDCLIIYVFAEHPNVVYEAPLHGCVEHCDERQQLILKINFFLDGLWQLAGPATCRTEAINETITVSPYIDDMAKDVWFIRGCPPSVLEREMIFESYCTAWGGWGEVMTNL